MGCILFILIRSVIVQHIDINLLIALFLFLESYLSMLTLIVSEVGFFGSFSESECSHYYLAAPVLKGTLTSLTVGVFVVVVVFPHNHV